MDISIGVFASGLRKLGLPTEGLTENGSTLGNHYERVAYLNSLDDEQKVIFIKYLLWEAYNLGITHGEETAFAQIDDQDD